ncbi:hypothetical protein ACBQ04_12715, partial [Psychrobacter faecalis]
IVRLVMCRLLSLRDDTMIVFVSQTKLPDSSNPLSDIVGAVHRVLRRFPGKTKATIYDFVVLPCPYIKSDFAKKLYESELERVRDFSLLAMNKVEIESQIHELEV